MYDGRKILYPMIKYLEKYVWLQIILSKLLFVAFIELGVLLIILKEK